MTGAFITFEGGEGSGKSSQIRMLESRLAAEGVATSVFREPGGGLGGVGERIREVLLDPAHDALDPLAELLLYEAARAQLVAEKIAPLLDAGEVVLCDRYADSTLAYQGFGRAAAPLDVIRELNAIATRGVAPDLTLLLDVDPALGLACATHAGADRLEREELAFHQRVRAGFLAVAAEDPDRVVVVPRDRPDAVADQVWGVVRDLLVRLGVLH